jgi:hypothetical protein
METHPVKRRVTGGLIARILLSVRDIWWSRHYRTEMPPNKTTNIPPRGRVKTICPETVFDTNPLNQKAKSLLSFLSRLLKYGSSDWMRNFIYQLEFNVIYFHDLR